MTDRERFQRLAHVADVRAEDIMATRDKARIGDYRRCKVDAQTLRELATDMQPGRIANAAYAELVARAESIAAPYV